MLTEETIAKMFISARDKASSKPVTMREALGNKRKADPVHAPCTVGADAIYEASGAPDGAMSSDKANIGWSGAWARQYSTRAGNSERRSMRVGSSRGAPRGEQVDKNNPWLRPQSVAVFNPSKGEITYRKFEGFV